VPPVLSGMLERRNRTQRGAEATDARMWEGNYDT
jgi:hypothetical protein